MGMNRVRHKSPDQPYSGPICLQVLEHPFLSGYDTAEWPRKGRIVMGDNLLCFKGGCITACMTIGYQHGVESKISCSAAGAVNAILGFHTRDDHAFNAKRL